MGTPSSILLFLSLLLPLFLLLLLFLLLSFSRGSLSSLYNSLKVIRLYQAYHCLSATFSNFHLVIGRLGLDFIHFSLLYVFTDFHLNIPFVYLFIFLFFSYEGFVQCVDHI